MKRIAITCGDVNGIGPEIALKLIDKISTSSPYQIVYFSPYNVFLEACDLCSISLEHEVAKKNNELEALQNNLIIFDIGRFQVKPSKQTSSAGRMAFKALEAASEMIKNGYVHGLVTAPISKLSMKKAGFGFPGHTEYLASKASEKNYLMMFLSNKLKCALATIHIPISEVASSINESLLSGKIELIIESLRTDFRIESPTIAVLGLNPHAGENGSIGTEEVIIKKVIDSYKGIAHGPFVPDAFFTNKLYKNFNIVLGMYHDQMLIPFKMLDFKKGVNFTAGLPFVRTSPDHGTGFDIAWQNKADHSSMEAAYRWAVRILKNRSKT